jgi:hypothetical protein
MSKVVFRKVEAKPFTVILAARESDKSLFLGADTCDNDDYGIKSTIHKLRKIRDDIPLAWSGSGNYNLFKDFTDWLINYKWPPLEWDIFDRDIRNRIADLNANQRAYCKRSGVEWKIDYGLVKLPSKVDLCHKNGLTGPETFQLFGKFYHR